MASMESQRIRATLVNDREMLDVPLEVQRQEWQTGAAQVQLPPDTRIASIDAAGVPGEWVSVADTMPGPVILFLHGGGFTAGSCVTHRELASRLSRASGCGVLLLDYRLAPEHPFPCAVHDAVTGYQWLLTRGIKPEQIVLAGDSAGGGLAVSALLALRDQGITLPVAAVLLSPWLDLALTGASMHTHAAIDPLCSFEGLSGAADYYLSGIDPKTPLASPIYGELKELPPLLIQVGSLEILLSDSERLAERARAAGVEVILEVWDEMWHVWHAFAGMLPEGQQAIQQIGAFIREKVMLPDSSDISV